MIAMEKIILTVPAGTKARWVSQSQAQGKKLSDWVCEAVERPANKAATSPCPRCQSLVLVPDGPGLWQCAQCGLAA